MTVKMTKVKYKRLGLGRACCPRARNYVKGNFVTRNIRKAYRAVRPNIWNAVSAFFRQVVGQFLLLYTFRLDTVYSL